MDFSVKPMNLSVKILAGGRYSFVSNLGATGTLYGKTARRHSGQARGSRKKILNSKNKRK
jgi:hypothetical protein